MKSLHIAALALLLCVPAFVAQAQPAFTDADLEGTWAFQQMPLAVHYPATGTLTADGLGHLTGVRNVADRGLHGFSVEQNLTGTYVVNADGTGSASLISSPPVPQGTGEEEITFVIVNADRFWFTGITLQLSGPAPPYRGEAIRQRAPGESDDVQARLEALESLSCELVRLLLTPEGRRASDCCGALMDFPDGKDAPSCGGTTVTSPSPMLPAAHVPAPPKQR